VGLAAEYAAARLTRRGLHRHCADTRLQLADALLPLTGDDVVLVFVPGRHNRDVEAILTHAQRTGAQVILVTSSLDTRVGNRVLVTLQPRRPICSPNCASTSRGTQPRLTGGRAMRGSVAPVPGGSGRSG
jgi:DNA-binding MurR/RpiR family transcriptional regulator